MLYVDRLFSQVDIYPKQPTPEEWRDPQPFVKFADSHALVILGAPGAGKTTSFKYAAETDTDSVFVDLRKFNRTTNLSQYARKTLYIDALDEVRSQARGNQVSIDTSIIDNLIRNLETIGRPRFRLSCRSLDWYGSVDLRHLADATSDGRVVVIALNSLSELDIATIVSASGEDGSDFVDKARKYGVLEMARNPENLRLLIEVVGQGAAWPSSRSDLYERATLKLLQECRDTHLRTDRGRFVPEELADSAGRLCAVALCSNRTGYALWPDESDDLHPVLRQVAPGDEKAEATLHRRLFPSPQSGQVELPHRMIAEYVAACHIRRLVRENGLPFTRALALCTTSGGTIANLRGIYGWLVAMSGCDAPALLQIDPIAVIQQGDLSLLPVEAKAQLIHLVGSIGEDKLWTFHEMWAGEIFGPLATSDMESMIESILSDPASKKYSVICVLEALRHAPQPLQALEDVLRKTMWNPDLMFGGRAIDAYCRNAPDPLPELRRLLDAINEDHFPDDGNRWRGRLLTRLYPHCVRAAELGKYLTSISSNETIDEYDYFLFKVAKLTPPSDLPDLLDSIEPLRKSLTRSGKQMVGDAIALALKHHGETAEPARIYRWLNIWAEKNGSSALENEKSAVIREWFETHSHIIIRLLSYWRSLIPEKEAANLDKFWRLLSRHKPHASFGYYLLKEAADEDDPKMARLLFKEATLLRLASNQPGSPSIEELYAFVDANPVFKTDFIPKDAHHDALTYCVVADWQWEEAERLSRLKQEQQVRRATNLAQLGNISLIQSGTNLNALLWAGEIYWRGNEYKSPLERIAEESSDEIAAAALTGFDALLHSSTLHTPSDIGELQAQSRNWKEAYPILAGIRETFLRSKEALIMLPEAALAAAVCYSNVISSSDRENWLDLLAQRKPKLVSQALLDFWRPQFLAGVEWVPLLDLLNHSESWADVARRLALSMLQEFAECPKQHLRDLILIGLRFAEPVHLLPTLEAAIDKATGESKILWLTAAALLNPQRWMSALVIEVGSQEDVAAEVLALAADAVKPGEAAKAVLVSTAAMAGFAAIGCMACRHSVDKYGFLDDRSRSVQTFIDWLAADPSRMASEILQQLLSDPRNASWHNELRKVVDVQTRNRRDVDFQWPSPQQIVSTLEGREPANHEDFLALLEGELRLLARHVRDGASNTYRRFWNTGARPSPRCENDARDHLLDLLQVRLRHFGIICEPEGSFADDKRADIKVMSARMTLPVEIKRHYHRDLWSAPLEQLNARYSRDPAADGRGIYLVIWYGASEGRRLPKLPDGTARPANAHQLEQLLRIALPLELQAKLKIICIDVTWPNQDRRQ